MPSFQTYSSIDSEMKSFDRSEAMQSISSSHPDQGFRLSSEPYEEINKDQFHQSTGHLDVKAEQDTFRSTPVDSNMASSMDVSMQEDGVLPQMSNAPPNPASSILGSMHSDASGSKTKSKKTMPPHRKGSSTGGDQDEFEMDESIQKSTIMMKRLRSKSESKKSVHQQLPAARDDGGCVMCSQTHEGPDNKIVLCDSCDRGFHQACYSPTIENKFVDTELEWTCYSCSLPLSTTSSQGLSALTEDMSLTGQQVAQGVKDNYLRSLSKSNLVKLINRIEANSPSIKLYPSRLSSPIVPTSDHSSFATSTVSETLVPLDLAQQPSQAMTISPVYLGVPVTDSDYFANANISSSHPATPSTPKQSGRQTPAPTSGSGVSGTYNSVKGQDLPPYEEMIFMAIADLKQEAGSAPKSILDWVQEHYPVPETFRASCGQAISKAAKKGRLLKEGAMYKLKPGFTYPRRVSRQVGSTRARSRSYNSALPLGVPSIDSSSRSNPASLPYDQINSIIDANLYGMLPSPTFRVPPQSGGVPVFGPNAGLGGAQRLQQTVHPFKFDVRPMGQIHQGPQQPISQDPSSSSTDNKTANANELIGLGVTTIPSTFPGDNDTSDPDSTRRSSSMSSVSSGQHSFTGTFQGVDHARTLQAAQRVQQAQHQQQGVVGLGQDRTWTMTPSGGNQAQVGIGGLVGAPGLQATTNRLSIMTGGLHHQGLFPGQVIQSPMGPGASPLSFTTPSFANLGSMTLPSQQGHAQPPQPLPIFSPHGPSLGHGPLAINTSIASPGVIGIQGSRSGTPMYSSIFIPQNLQYPSQHPQQQPLFTGAAPAGLYNSMSLPASPQDPTPQMLSSQRLFRDPIMIHPTNTMLNNAA
ncbi:hypothetical protein EDD11_007263, partial [Mortierella claussenii]